MPSPEFLTIVKTNRGPKSYSTSDHINAGGAMLLAAQIKHFWERRGNKVDVWVEPFTIQADKLRGSTFAIRSDLIGGLPRGK
jgi:hypothetical protein